MNPHKKLRPFLFLLPAMLMAIIFTYYPFIKTFIFSMSQVNQLGIAVDFIWFENFLYLFTYEPFWIALKNTLLLTIFFVPLNLLFSLGLALLSEKRRKYAVVYENLFLAPMTVSMPTASLIFKVILSPVGIVNSLLSINYPWFTHKNTAIWGILMLCLWMDFSFDYLLLLQGLRNIPRSRLEAATLDGANGLKKLIHIKIPAISPTILYVVFINIAKMMMISGPMMIITEGGPSRSTSSLIYLMYVSGFESSNYGLASAIAIFTFLLTASLSAAALYFNTKRLSVGREKKFL